MLIDRLRNLQGEIVAQIRSALGALPAAELAEVLMVNPYVRISDIVESGLAKRQTASTWLAALVKSGVLKEKKIGRQKIFLNVQSLDVLTSN